MDRDEQLIEQLARELEQDMRREAVQRLRTIVPNNPELAEKFEESGTIYTYDFSLYLGRGRKRQDYVREADSKEMKVVDYMEGEQGNLPFLIIKRVVEYSVFYYFLYVSYDKRNWSVERSAIQKHGRPYREPYVFEIETEICFEDKDTIDMRFHKFTELKLDLD